MAKMSPVNMDRSTPASVGLNFGSLSSATPSRRPAKPVFLHGMWRSGSTYLWSRFRQASGATCFYEPLHHGLAKLTQERIYRDDAEKIRGNGHPDLAEPYFAEFAPLIEGRGVRHYRKELAYDRFALEAQEPHPRLEAYIGSLIDHATDQGRQAVLGFNRTGLRIAWLRSHFDAHHIHIDRDPVGVWASYRSEADKGNFAFFSMWLRVLEANSHHPLLAPLHDRLGLRRLAAPPFYPSRDRHRLIIEDMRDAETYFMVFYLWMVCTRHAVKHCDYVLETSRSDRLSYRRQAQDDLEAATGIRLDLSQMRAAPARAGLSDSIRQQVERSAISALPPAVKSDLLGWFPNTARPKAMMPALLNV